MGVSVGNAPNASGTTWQPGRRRWHDHRVGLVDRLPAAPGEDDFRALARSSPWRFTTLHLTHHRSDPGPAGRPSPWPVEAWLTRPWHLRVRTADGHVEEVTGLPYTMSYLTTGPS
jgi:hypothetical protein